MTSLFLQPLVSRPPVNHVLAAIAQHREPLRLHQIPDTGLPEPRHPRKLLDREQNLLIRQNCITPFLKLAKLFVHPKQTKRAI